jgi:hypothetical protein
VDKEVAVARGEDKAATELEWILPELTLLVSGAFGPRTRFSILAAKEMEQVAGFQFRSMVGDPIVIDQQWKRDSGFLAKHAGIVHVAQPDRGQTGSCLFELTLPRAQLRDMLAAEDSAVVPQKDHNGGVLLP